MTMERSAEISHDLWFAANKNFFRDKFGRLEEWNFFREIEGISTTLKSRRIYVVFLCDSVKESLPLLDGQSVKNLLLGLIEDKRVLGWGTNDVKYVFLSFWPAIMYDNWRKKKKSSINNKNPLIWSYDFLVYRGCL